MIRSFSMEGPMEGLFKRLIHAILTVKYSESQITDEPLESVIMEVSDNVLTH